MPRPAVAVALSVWAAVVLWSSGSAGAGVPAALAGICGLAGGLLSLRGRIGVRRCQRGELGTAGFLRSAEAAGLRLFQGRALVLAAGSFVAAALLAVAFPGRMAGAAAAGGAMAPAILLLLGLAGAKRHGGWMLDLALPDRLLVRTIPADVLSAFAAGWSAAGRVSALRRAAVMHPDAPEGARAMMMARHAPAAVFVPAGLLGKTWAGELLLRLAGWRVLAAVMAAAALLSLLAMAVLPPGALGRVPPLGEISGLAAPRHAPEPAPDEPAAADPPGDGADTSGPSPGAAGGGAGQGSGAADPGEAGGGQGAGQGSGAENPGSQGGSPEGQAGSAAGDGPGEGTGGDGDTADPGPASEGGEGSGEAGSAGATPAAAGGEGTAEPEPVGPGPDAASGEPGGAGSTPAAAEPGGDGASDTATAGGPGDPSPAGVGSGQPLAAGGDGPAGEADPGGGPGFRLVATDEPAGGDGPAVELPFAPPGEARPADPAAAVAGAAPPEEGAQPDLPVGGPAQLFAEPGAAPESIAARLLPGDEAAAPPVPPAPPRQLLPAWINELVR